MLVVGSCLIIIGLSLLGGGILAAVLNYFSN